MRAVDHHNAAYDAEGVIREENHAYCEKILAAAAGACACDWTGGLANRLSGADEHVAQHGNRQQGSPAERRADHAGESGYSVQNEPYVPLYEVAERLGGTTDGKTYTLHGAETAVSGVERNGVLYTPFSYLWDSHIPQIRWDKSRNRVIITEAPDEIPLTRRWLFWRHRTVRGLRVGDSEARFLDLYGSPDARDETMVDLLHVTIENGIVTEIFMGRYE